MKFRVRFNIEKYFIQIGDNVKTINELKAAISSEVRGLPESFCLSLDGVSALDEEEGNRLISDAGMVSGDLIHILSSNGGNVISPTINSKPSMLQNQRADDINESSISSLNEAAAMEVVTPMDVDNESENIVLRKACPSNTLRADDEEFLLSQSIELVTSRFKRLPPSRERSLAIVLHCLMSELGFKLINKNEYDDEEEEEDDGGDVNAIKMAFGHPAFNKMSFQLFLITMMNKSILHGSSMEDGEVVQKDSLKIDPDTIIWKHNSQDSVLKSLRRDELNFFRKRFRDQIGNQMIQSALRAHGFREMAELSTLPYEVQLKVLDLLDVPSLLRLSEASKFWKLQCFEPLVWKKKYLQLVGKEEASSKAPSSNWLELYKEAYKMRKRSRFSGFRCPRPTLERDHQSYIYPPYNPFQPNPFPGVIGGYYDLYPGGPGMGTGPRFPPFHPPAFDPPFQDPFRGRRPGRGIFPPRGRGGRDWF